LKESVAAFLKVAVAVAVALLVPFGPATTWAQQSEPARVLDSQEVDLGERSIIYERIETPELKPTPPEPVQRALSGEMPDAGLPPQQWVERKQVTLFLSCAVHAGAVTEVRWHRAGGEIVFWSMIDFHHLRTVSDFHAGDTDYFLMLGIGDAPEGEAGVPAGDPLRTRAESPASLLAPFAGPSGYRLASFAPPDAVNAIGDLHRYFDANCGALIRAFEESETARVAREEWLEANPPQPKDTVIRYFPIRSAYAPGNLGSGGAR
jgi:hypothetical protein